MLVFRFGVGCVNGSQWRGLADSRVAAGSVFSHRIELHLENFLDILA